MFRVINKKLAIIFLVSNVNSLICVLMKNQECKIREVIMNNDYMLYPFSIKVNRCYGNCNNMSNPYSRVCVPNVIKILLPKCLILCHGKIKQKK